MQSVILACQTMKDELQLVMQQLGVTYPVVYLESGLHNSPELLREKVQEQVNTLKAKTIMMVFGCCGKGLVGIKANKAKLIIPRIDDCVTLLLGSTENRRRISGESSTYFITKGWLDPQGNIMWSYLEWVERYGEQKALRITKKMLAHYTKFMIINTGAYKIESILPSIQDFCERFDMCYEVTTGSLRLLYRLLIGPWDSEFIIVQPGQEIYANDFYPELAQDAKG